MEDRTIRIITTGGTFDKHYDAVKGELTFRESHLPRILNQSRVTLPIHLDALFAVDSLVMTEEQRASVADNAIASVEELVVIIHGTDTMVKTAQLLESKLPEHDNHVYLFTGAMIPYALEESDAVFNLGCAIASVQLLSPGVYITMGGRIYSADNVRKNKEKGIFEVI
ncbi:MAG: asparaginase [Spirochaetes bacterium]|uniref:Asparaginase n=1 Tax=Candidatus Ornithospirochaeta stercoripullorum TaxID=2840899 RepID=A0A9D9DWN5_9SPIO|nr:asparaginase [Candidatus Ornithospirochaeta stercoripullorum]